MWTPERLSHTFGPDVFAPRAIPGEDNSGLTRKYVNGNQNNYAHGTCFVVPIKKCELRNKIITTDHPRDCFVFVANTPDIVIEAQQVNSDDDLDLSVTEPNGVEVNYTHPLLKCGRLNDGDKNIDGCERKKEEREKVECFRSCPNGLQTGQYTATLRHVTNCGEGITSYSIRVLINGRVVKSHSGFSNEDMSHVVATLTFNIRCKT